ncbi:MAG TPA: YjbQ family protein [Roseiarcus sp.]
MPAWGRRPRRHARPYPDGGFGVQLSVPVIQGRLALGMWQGVYLFEHRRAPRRREIALHPIGE